MFEHLRLRVVIPRVQGRLLDIGCGANQLVRQYGKGLGVNRLSDVPSDSQPFNTVSLVAVLNYIKPTERESVLRGCSYYLAPYGRLLITCVTPLGSLLLPREPRGLWPQQIISLTELCGFKLVYRRPFMCGLNWLYVFSKEDQKTTLAVSAYRKEVEEVKKAL